MQGEATLSQLSKIRLDKTQIYSVRDITITRDVLSISLNRGAIAFTEPIEGQSHGSCLYRKRRYPGHSTGLHRKETAVPIHQIGSVERTLRDGRLSFHGRNLGGDSEGISKVTRPKPWMPPTWKRFFDGNLKFNVGRSFSTGGFLRT